MIMFEPIKRTNEEHRIMEREAFEKNRTRVARKILRANPELTAGHMIFHKLLSEGIYKL